jgi:opacity protein-like surface antigen
MMRGSQCLVGLVGLMLLWCVTAEAVSTPNPVAPSKGGRFFLAGDFDFRFEKDIDFDNGGKGEFDDMLNLFLRPGYAVIDNVTVYGRIGLWSADDIDPGFTFGAGAQGVYIVPRAPEWRVGGTIDFLYAGAEVEDSDADVWFVEFQLTLAGGYAFRQVPGLYPYAGFMLNFLSGEVEVRGRDQDFDQDDVFGLLFGASFDVTDNLKVEGQFRLISEDALFLSVSYRF